MAKRFIKVIALLLFLEFLLGVIVVFFSTSDFYPIRILASVLDKIIGFPINMIHPAYPFYAETAIKGIVLFIVNLLIQSIILTTIISVFTDRNKLSK